MQVHGQTGQPGHKSTQGAQDQYYKIKIKNYK